MRWLQAEEADATNLLLFRAHGGGQRIPRSGTEKWALAIRVQGHATLFWSPRRIRGEHGRAVTWCSEKFRYVKICAVEGMDTNSLRMFLAISILFCAIIRAFWMSWWEYPWLKRCSISLLICWLGPGLAPGGTGLGLRSELMRRGNGLGGRSGASEGSRTAENTIQYKKSPCVYTDVWDNDQIAAQ